ncbi:hypothetical protein [Mesorhizobium sp. KR2-14]|uniref:hypothetical protein n=1 Tax=Mesorhizobium sp. KR2-14 TaxID=3156610 RepID=UPI0032B49F22
MSAAVWSFDLAEDVARHGDRRVADDASSRDERRNSVGNCWYIELPTERLMRK